MFYDYKVLETFTSGTEWSDVIPSWSQSKNYFKILGFPTFQSPYSVFLRAMGFEGGKNPGVILK